MVCFHSGILYSNEKEQLLLGTTQWINDDRQNSDYLYRGNNCKECTKEASGCGNVLVVVLIQMLVTCINIPFVKIYWPMYLLYVYFSEYVLYSSKKVQEEYSILLKQTKKIHIHRPK